MKKVIVLFLFTLFLSCTSDKNESQVENYSAFKKAPLELLKKFTEKIDFKTKIKDSKINYGSLTPCDNAASVGITYSYDFEFHRPIYNCESGFWFCGTWTPYWTCYDASGNILYQEEIQKRKNSVPKGKYLVEVSLLKNNEIILEFPKEQLMNEGYTIKDLSFFNVDDELQVFPGGNFYFLKGDYPVYENEDKLIVLVKTKSI